MNEQDQEIKIKLQKHEEQGLDQKAPWSDDHLDRERSAQILGRVLLTIEQPYVVAINSPFGTGKSFFVKRLMQDLRNNGQVALSFNAWEKDNHGQPLLSFVGELQKQLEGYGITKKRSAVKKVLEGAGNLFLRKGIPAAARIATAGIVGDKDIEALGQIGAELVSGAGSVAEGLVHRQVETEAAFVEFRKNLEKLAAEAMDKTSESAKAIYIFIDELDRCRPPYALELLENIKHLFSVPGMVFVLAIDRDHLKNSISTIYGADMDSDGYLARFIDQNYQLPPANPTAYAGYLSKRFGLNEVMARRREGRGELESLLKGFSEFAGVFGISLRDQEQAMAEINFVLRNKPPTQHISAPLIGMMAVLKRTNLKAYEEYCLGHLLWSDLEDLIRLQPEGGKWLGANNTLFLRSWLLIGNVTDSNQLYLQSDKIVERINVISSAGRHVEDERQERDTLDEKRKLYLKAIQISEKWSEYVILEGSDFSSPISSVYSDLSLATKYSGD